LVDQCFCVFGVEAVRFLKDDGRLSIDADSDGSGAVIMNRDVEVQTSKAHGNEMIKGNCVIFACGGSAGYYREHKDENKEGCVSHGEVLGADLAGFVRHVSLASFRNRLKNRIVSEKRQIASTTLFTGAYVSTESGMASVSCRIRSSSESIFSSSKSHGCGMPSPAPSSIRPRTGSTLWAAQVSAVERETDLFGIMGNCLHRCTEPKAKANG
jgi:hypothetical protein